MPRYLVDAAASRIRIEARTTMHPVVVETSRMHGHLDVEVADDGSVTVPAGADWLLVVPGSALKSGNAIIDRETDRRVNWRRHPDVCGELVGVQSKGRDGALVIEGDITFHGAQRRMTGPVTVARAEDGRVRVRGAATLDVRDFGLKPPRLLMLKVEPRVTVSIDLRAVPQG